MAALSCPGNCSVSTLQSLDDISSKGREPSDRVFFRTARPANLEAKDWRLNGLSRKVSHSYGFGLMDATAMVRLARRWKNVPEQVGLSHGVFFQGLILRGIARGVREWREFPGGKF